MATLRAQLARGLGVQAGEGRILAWSAVVYLLVHAASVLLANLSDTYFLKRIGVNLLPAAFLVSSLLLVLTTSIAARLATRRAPLPLLVRTLIGLALLLVPLWLLVVGEVTLVYAAMVVVSKQVESIAVLVFWVALGGLLHARQAKRLYAPIVAGGTLGEIAGSFASGAIARHVGMAALLPIASLVLLLAAFLVSRASASAPARMTRAPRDAPDVGTRGALLLFGPIWRESRLFRILAVSALLCGMLGPMLYFQFSYVADQATRGANGELRLLELYAAFRGWLNIAVLVLQLVGTARVFRRIGVPLAATFSPLVYLFGFVGVGLRLGLEAAVAAMAGANIQDHALYDPAQKVLVTLFPERLRPAATTLIGGPILRAGGALGNLVVLILIGLGAHAWVPAVGVPIAGLWAVAALTLWRIYPSLLLEVASTRHLLKPGDGATRELVDAATVRVLESELTGGDDDRARAACSLLLEAPATAAVGALARAVRAAPPARRTLLFETLHRVLDAQPEHRRHNAAAARELGALLATPPSGDDLAQALLILAYARLGADLQAGSLGARALQDLRGAASAAVRLAAAACLAHAAATADGDIDAAIAAALDGGDAATRRIAIEVLRTLLLRSRSGAADDAQWDTRLALLVRQLDDRPSRARAAEALADVATRHGTRIPADQDRLVDHLDDPDPRVRIAALRFVGGTRMETPLRAVVDHLASDDAAESAAAAAALRAVGSPAAHALIAAILRGRRTTREAALPLLREHPVAPAALASLIDREVARIQRLALQRHGLGDGGAPELVLQRLRERIEESAHAGLLLLAALRDDDRLAVVARLLIRSERGRPRAVLLEALEALLPPPERSRLLPLLDHDSGRAATAAAQALGRELPSPDVAHADLIAEGDALTLAFVAVLAGRGDLPHSGRRDVEPPEPEVLKQVERVLQLRSVGLFAGLTTQQLTDLAAVMREERFAAGTDIVREGDFGDCLYVIVTGRVQIVRGGQILTHSGPGDFFGEMAVFDGETRSATVRAAEQVDVLGLERHELLQLLDEQPSIAIAMCQTLARRLRGVMASKPAGG